MEPSWWDNRLKSFKANRWSYVALGVLIGGLLMSRGGALALAPLARVLLPLLAIYWLFRWGKRKFITAASEALRRQMGEQGLRWPGPGQAPGGAPKGPVIDLCPQCGTYLAPGHRCKR